MANGFAIPRDVETRLRARFKTCAYCGGRMKAHLGVVGTPGDKATIEHLNRRGPFHWADGLKEEELVICCGRCNSSRGRKRLVGWFASEYCRTRGITAKTVVPDVQAYLRLAIARK